ncbi:4'-phosphopantetheinyl transferase family protein [Pectinatus haikarae]|uniref:4'-phosphopantetheinyl transferase family protein n=1 Tax=Pectinatus haikarae TaxID=349096 RepID=UPI001E38CAD7|nr:4'-phosphopantetheinyl transferase superfamily protein [Pectinatus haikarae]
MPESIDVYAADIRCLENERLFAASLLRLSAERRRKSAAAAAVQNRRLSVGAGLLLNHALQKYGINGRMVKFWHNEYGKPFLSDYNIYFSLSHSGHYVFCAAGSEEVGADIQKNVRYNAHIIKRFFHQEEQAYIFSLPQSQQSREFFRLWTFKESCVKMLGSSLARELSSFSIDISEQTVAARANGNALPYTFTEYDINGYFAAVCSKAAYSAGSIQWVDFAK